jgi:molecular chaperone GrpE
MAMDETEQLKEQSEQAKATKPAPGEEESSSRLDAAKAFFRALHAGGETPSAEFGVEGQAGQPRSSGACPSCQRLETQVSEAEQKAAESDSLYRRMAADFENYRRRVDREREELQSVGIQKAAEMLLPALDDMDRAQSSLNSDTPPDKLLESLNLVFNRITRCLEQMGIKQLSVIGEHFDPKFHEPVQEIETTDFPDGAVMQELRRGYTINDKVIRPALVNVASNSTGSVRGAEPAQAVSAEPAEGEPKVYDLSDFEGDDEGGGGKGGQTGEPADAS